MPQIDRTVSKKPVQASPEAIAHTLNSEVVPVLLLCRAAINGRLDSYAETVGDGSTTSFSISHGFDTQDVLVQVYSLSTGLAVTPSAIDRLSTSEVVVSFGVAPATDDYRVLVRS